MLTDEERRRIYEEETERIAIRQQAARAQRRTWLKTLLAAAALLIIVPLMGSFFWDIGVSLMEGRDIPSDNGAKISLMAREAMKRHPGEIEPGSLLKVEQSGNYFNLYYSAAYTTESGNRVKGRIVVCRMRSDGEVASIDAPQ